LPERLAASIKDGVDSSEVFLMQRTRLLLFAVLLSTTGCGGNRGQWEVTFENKSAKRCSVAVDFGPGTSGGASADGVDPGESISVVAGPGTTVIKSLMIRRDGATETLTPNEPLKAGERFKIKVDADGKVQTSVSKD
jgi:hypothetical protein